MSEKIREWGVTSYDASRFNLIHIDSSEREDLLEGHIDDNDARLIVAAPELLEALEKCVFLLGSIGHRPNNSATAMVAFDAIAKAKGEKE